ncbi:hypothetical protein ACET3Z_003883 [Daucus carota]
MELQNVMHVIGSLFPGLVSGLPKLDLPPSHELDGPGSVTYLYSYNSSKVLDTRAGSSEGSSNSGVKSVIFSEGLTCNFSAENPDIIPASWGDLAVNCSQFLGAPRMEEPDS